MNEEDRDRMELALNRELLNLGETNLDAILEEARIRLMFRRDSLKRVEEEQTTPLENCPAEAKLPNSRNDGHSKPGTMPEFGLKLLPFLLPRKLRDAVTGDLTEDFRAYATRWGRPYAMKWLYWELAILAVKRVSPAVIISAFGAWCRQKLGL